MNPHDDRAKIEGLLQWLHPDNADLKLEPDKIQLILSKVAIQVLLDIRDVLYKTNDAQGVSKWGPKFDAPPFVKKKEDKPVEQPDILVATDPKGQDSE